jgi:carboxypeptidase Taq
MLLTMSEAIQQLRERLAGLTDLGQIAYLLDWDQQTMMPPAGAAARAEAKATLGRIRHEMFISDETGRLLEAASGQLNGDPPDSDEASLVRVVRRRWDKARRVPSTLAAEMARAGALGHEAWVHARANKDYESFAPFLERNIDLARRYIECLPEFDEPYDALLDDYEPGMRTAAVRRIFGELRDELMPLISAIGDAEQVDDSCVHGRFPIAGQRALVKAVLERMSFNTERWRLDEAAHPFATSFGCDDVRLTTRWDETFWPSSLFGAMHECGHGLYEAGIARSLQRTPLGHAESLGLHESQSRMWENMVGRGRAFANVLAPLINQHLGTSVDSETVFRAVNRVAPSFIRVEADEATYGLHIVIRFELEQELIEGRLTVADLPEAWNARYAEYLGLTVTDPALGVLQDVHWSGGSIGYFPTYALGNLIAGQLWERIQRDLPELDAQIEAGELMGLREWLREHVHRHGAKFTMAQLLKRVVGEPIAVGPFITYLKRKLTQVYGISL